MIVSLPVIDMATYEAPRKGKKVGKHDKKGGPGDQGKAARDADDKALDKAGRAEDQNEAARSLLGLVKKPKGGKK
jgi:hypothetical protein